MTKLENARFMQILAVVWVLFAIGWVVAMVRKGDEHNPLTLALNALMYAALGVAYFIVGTIRAKKAKAKEAGTLTDRNQSSPKG